MFPNLKHHRQNSIPKFFGIGSGQRIARELCDHLGVELQQVKEEKFPDGETKLKPLENIASHDIVVIGSMAFEATRSPNEKICELLFFVKLLKNEGAEHITAILPYLSYSRSDQKKEPFDPLTLSYLAQLYEAVGIETILTLDVHNIAAFQNAFRCSNINIEAAPLFCEHLKSHFSSACPLVIMSPDLGGIKRVEKFRNRLQLTLARPVSMAVLEKYREKEGLLGQSLVGSVKGAHVFIYDDMISTGKTVLRAAEVARENGAMSLTVIATHGLFSEAPEEILQSPLIDEVIVTNSNPSLHSPQFEKYSKLKILSCVPLLARSLGF